MSVGFKCPSCAGDLTANPGGKTTKCPFCGISVLVPDELLDRRQIWPAEVIEAGRTASRAGWLTPRQGVDTECLQRFEAGGTGRGCFTDPWDMAVDGEGCICVTDVASNRMQVFDRTGGVRYV